jgi:hypothetical protein
LVQKPANNANVADEDSSDKAEITAVAAYKPLIISDLADVAGLLKRDIPECLSRVDATAGASLRLGPLKSRLVTPTLAG